MLSAWALSSRIALPRTQVHISKATTAASTTGTKPPSKNFSRLAPRKISSTTRNGRSHRRGEADDQPQTRRKTTKASRVVMIIVPVTAMP